MKVDNGAAYVAAIPGKVVDRVEDKAVQVAANILTKAQKRAGNQQPQNVSAPEKRSAPIDVKNLATLQFPNDLAKAEFVKVITSPNEAQRAAILSASQD